MRTAKVKNILRLRGGVAWLGVFGICGGLLTHSSWSALTSGILWWMTGKLIDIQWQYAERGGYIIDSESGAVVGQTTKECYVNRKDLPKKFKIIQYKGETVVNVELLVVNLVHGGFIIPLQVQIVCAVGVSAEAVKKCHWCLTRGGQTFGEYIEWAFQYFRKTQHPTTGVFGHDHSLQIGLPDWVENVFKPQLQESLTEACNNVGLEIKTIAVTSGERQRSIIVTQRRDDYAEGVS